MIFFPKAKINIGLRITGKRSDGFHNLETIFYPVGLCDVLEFVVLPDQTGKDLITQTGIDVVINQEDNLVYKALIKLRQKHNFPFLNIHLHKIIPAGAGLGGGSSDAACMLKTVSRGMNLQETREELKSMALELGSDCPFFLNGVPSFAEGRGEIITPVKPLSGYHIVLVNPGVGISTKEAFQNCRPVMPDVSLAQLYNKPVTEWKNLIFNDFEAYAFKKYPLIGELKNELYEAGALFSLMSGSGSSVYGIFSKRPEIPETLEQYVIFRGFL